MKQNLQPLKAELVEIRATAQEAKKLRGELLNKTSVIVKAVDNPKPITVWTANGPTEWQVPQGPMRIGGKWFV